MSRAAIDPRPPCRICGKCEKSPYCRKGCRNRIPALKEVLPIACRNIVRQKKGVWR